MKHGHPLRDFEPEELRLPKDLCIKLSVDHYKTWKGRPDTEESLCREDGVFKSVPPKIAPPGHSSSGKFTGKKPGNEGTSTITDLQPRITSEMSMREMRSC